MEIKLGLVPCECEAGVELDKDGSLPEYFDRRKIAAFRVREHVLNKDEHFAVHFNERHIEAVTIEGEVVYGNLHIRLG